MRVLVIETQRTVPIGSLGPPLVEAGLELAYWPTAEEPPPASLDGYAGVIALGGAVNPDQDAEYAWLGHERHLLQAALERRLPTMGLCLGAELLAQVLGGDARRLPQPKIGWFELERADRARHDHLVAHLPPRFSAFEWHGYQMTMPPGASLVAGDEQAPQAFAWQDFAWAFQFHLEANEGIIGGWVAHYEDELHQRGPDPTTLIRETRRQAAQYEAVAATVARAYAKLVKSTAQATVGMR